MPVQQNVDDSTAPLLEHTTQDKAEFPKFVDYLTAPFRWFWNNGIVCLLVSQVFYTSIVLIVKLLSDRIQVFQIVAIRSTFSLIIALVFSHVNKTSFFGPRNLMWLCMARGIFGASALTCLYAALYLLPLGDTVAIFKMNPATTAFLTWLLGFEQISFLMMLGIFGCLCGVVFITHPPMLFGGHEVWSASMGVGVALGMCANILAGAAYLTIGRIGKRATSFALLTWFNVMGLLMSVPFLVAGFPSKVVLDPTWQECVLLLAFCVFAFMGQLLVTRGMQLCNASIGTVVLTAELVMTYSMGYLVFDEGISWFDVVGGACIAGGVVLVAVGKQKTKKKVAQTETLIVDYEDRPAEVDNDNV